MTEKRKKTHHTSIDFPDSSLLSELDHQVFTFFFWRWIHLYFLTPLEVPKWQRSEHIRRHACHYSVSVACQWKCILEKCTYPVYLDVKKKKEEKRHFNSLGIKFQIHLSKLEKSSILRGKWAIDWGSETHRILTTKPSDYWLQILSLLCCLYM